MEMRPELQRALWDRIGCFQGDGKTVFALDPTLLEDGDSVEQFETVCLNSNQRAHLSQLKSVRLTPAVRPVVEQLRKISVRLDDLLGTKHDKQGLILALSNLLAALEPVGVWPEGDSRTALRGAIESFRNDDLKRQLDEARPLLADKAEIDLTSDSTLVRLGRLNLTVVERSEAFLNRIETFVDAVERELYVKERELTGVDPEADAAVLVQTLDQLDRDLDTIGGATSS